MGKVTLVGAGPGDAGLITVKGLEQLKTCDVVIYDRLSSDELLGVVKEDCILVYVGKKPGAHSMKQEEINRVLVEYARKYPDVVRLKGGDSFVFGRGGEEILALQEAGIPYEVVPGITSSVAVPEMAGIPVTHRGIARSFHVITGHTRYESPEKGVKHTADETDAADMHTTDTMTDDYETLAKLRGTLVFLMGLSNLEKIAEQLLRYGKAPDTPAAVIANGTTPYEKTVRGTLSDIAERVREAGLESPVVIVIGETAALHFKMESDRAAWRYGVVGTERTMEAFRRALPGTDVVPLIGMQVSETEQVRTLEEQVAHIPEYDWILFTSKQAVDTFFGVFCRQKTDIRKLAGCRFGVIGRGTCAALAEYGIHADFMPEQADAETFARQFAKHPAVQNAVQFTQRPAVQNTVQFTQRPAVQNAVQFTQHPAGQEMTLAGGRDIPEQTGTEQEKKQPVRVLIPRAKQGNPVLGEILREAGMEVCEIPVYDVVGKSYENFSEAAGLQNFVFFSASGVRAFFAEMGKRNMSLPAGSSCYCIGHRTRWALEQALGKMPKSGGLGMPQIITAKEQSVEGLVKKILEHMDR